MTQAQEFVKTGAIWLDATNPDEYEILEKLQVGKAKMLPKNIGQNDPALLFPDGSIVRMIDGKPTVEA
jgi:hypothetical protein